MDMAANEDHDNVDLGPALEGRHWGGSFGRANVKNVFVTGPPRCGKSTLIEKLVLGMEGPATGFFTREIREKGRRTGFSIMTLDGKKGMLAHEDMKSPCTVGRYGVNLHDIDRIAVPSMILSRPEAVVVVDEVGKMECFSSLFKQALLRILDSQHRVIGSIAQKGDSFIRKVRTRHDVFLVRLTEKNRNEPELLAGLQAWLRRMA